MIGSGTHRSRSLSHAPVFALLRPVLPGLAVVIGIVLILGVIILFVHYGTNADISLFLADPAEKSGLPAYAGVFTFAGILLWWTAATVAAISALLVRRVHGPRNLIRFFALLSGLIAFLCIDDLFLFHEVVGLWIAEAVGQPERRSTFELPVFVAYGTGWLLWFVWSWRMVLRTRWIFLLLAAFGFGMSLTVDVGVFLFPGLLPNTQWISTTLEVAEELFKVAGVMFLLVWVFITMIDYLDPYLHRFSASAENAGPMGGTNRTEPAQPVTVPSSGAKMPNRGDRPAHERIRSH